MTGATLTRPPVRHRETEFSMQAQLSSPPLFGDTRLPHRFWAKVRIGSVPADRPDLGPCWEWRACHTSEGYGRFRTGSRTDGSGRLVLAHRLAFEALIGAVPQGLEPDHLCRNSPCVNPAHLEPVTHAVNIQRSPLMGHGHREAKGETNSNAKLREADIPVIRALRGKMSQTEVAGWFGVALR